MERTWKYKFPIYMDPDRVGTRRARLNPTPVYGCFQFIWIPTESGRVVSSPKRLLPTSFQFIWIPTESGQSTQARPYLCGSCFQFIWIPTESGRDAVSLLICCIPGVSNLYGSRQSRDVGPTALKSAATKFPIYMDPDRVGTTNDLLSRIDLDKFPIYMDPDRVGTY